jgi:hypothetical protein
MPQDLIAQLRGCSREMQMAAERLDCEAAMGSHTNEGRSLRSKMRSIAAGLFGRMTLPDEAATAIERDQQIISDLGENECRWRDRACKAEAALERTLPASDEDVEKAAKLVERLRAALEPFAAMGRVMETRAIVTFGKTVPDSEIVCQSSGEAGHGILTMGHFRDAAALLPDAPGWSGLYIQPFDRVALSSLSSPPSDEDVEKRARELLAAEYEKDGAVEFAQEVRSGNLNRTGCGASLRAIIAALRQSSPNQKSIEAELTAKVVAWLRDLSKHAERENCWSLADRIERGDYLPTQTEASLPGEGK